MSTGTLFAITILCFLVGLLLIGGGILWLVVQNRKQRRRNDLRLKRQTLTQNPNVCRPSNLSSGPPGGQPPQE